MNRKDKGPRKTFEQRLKTKEDIQRAKEMNSLISQSLSVIHVLNFSYLSSYIKGIVQRVETKAEIWYKKKKQN
jgi:hypothetical protein